MNELRLKRYRDKINYVVKSVKVLDSKPQNELERRGIFYSLQTSIEAVIDLVAMCLKDAGIEVKNDENNIIEFIKLRNLNLSLGEELKKANGMRNIIVHRYNKIDEQIIIDSKEEIKDLLLEWIEQIEGILDEYSNNARN